MEKAGEAKSTNLWPIQRERQTAREPRRCGVGSIKRLMQRSRVLLPLPEGPRMVKKRPLGTWSDTPSRIRRRRMPAPTSYDRSSTASFATARSSSALLPDAAGADTAPRGARARTPRPGGRGVAGSRGLVHERSTHGLYNPRWRGRPSRALHGARSRHRHTAAPGGRPLPRGMGD